MKGAQDVRKKRVVQRIKELQKKEKNAKIIEELILEKFIELDITNIIVWEDEGFFVIDDDITDIPFDKYSESILYKEFNSEEGYCVDYIKMITGQEALKICIID